MLKLLTLLLVSTFSAICHAAVDWTPLLQSMKKGCAFDSEALPYGKSDIGKLPAKYRASVARSHSKQTASDGEAFTIELKKILLLLGCPLSAWTIESNEGYGYIK